jgi:hypothetical protein
MFDNDFDCGEHYEGEDYNVWEENQVYEDLRLEALEDGLEFVDDYHEDENHLDSYVEDELDRIRRNFVERGF